MFKIDTKFGVPCYVAVADEEKIKPENIAEDFAYVISKSGVYVKQKNFLYEGFFKMDNPAFLGEIEEDVTAKELKIPYPLFLSIESFFGDTYKKYKSEAAVLLYYNQAKNKWAYCVPHQTVSGASVAYDIAKGATYVVEDNLEVGLDNLPEGEWSQVGSIHSHASMSAFHSGVDDKDEFGFDGIHITIGGFNKPVHEYACRVMFGKKDFKKSLEEVVDCPTFSGRRPGDLLARVAEPEVKSAPISSGYQGQYGSQVWGGARTWSGGGTTRYTGGSDFYGKTSYQGRKESKKESSSEYPYDDGFVFMNGD